MTYSFSLRILILRYPWRRQESRKKLPIALSRNVHSKTHKIQPTERVYPLSQISYRGESCAETRKAENRLISVLVSILAKCRNTYVVFSVLLRILQSVP